MNGPVRAALVGAATGLRSQLGLAVVSATTSPYQAADSVAVLARPRVRAVAAALAAAELVADKWSGVPDRRTALGLGARTVNGATAAAALTARSEPTRSRPARHGPTPTDATHADAASHEPDRSSAALARAALVGAATAVGAAYLGASWRAAAARNGRPDWPAALAEDAAALTLAWTACARPRAQTADGYASAASASGSRSLSPPAADSSGRR
ncbi:DUF4126 family protein [Actinacidiphila yeochonensis]|uniref:DUF4126 family protein n=1 Tax=Actinacidiphila yeochonensis TaxID=89050 RepID=UPI0012FF207A|nr:DUF4126 family protein [Actinacidiphila yeochonensis]